MTEAVLTAKRAAAVSFSELAKELQEDEETVARLIFRRKQGTSKQAVDLAKALKQPEGGFDGLLQPPSKESRLWKDFWKGTADKALTALFTGIIIFKVQACYNEDQQIREKAASSANAISSILSTQTASLVNEYKSFRAHARGLVTLIKQDAATEAIQPAIEELKNRQGAISDCLDVLVPFAPNVAATKLREEFTDPLAELADELSASQVPTDLDARLTTIATRFKSLVSVLQRDVRRSVEQEYERAEERTK